MTAKFLQPPRMRANRPEVMAFVLAGGEGTRLMPLTTERCKPSVPFNGRYRIVDFVLSNLANSLIEPTYLLVQHKSQALIDHLRLLQSSPALGDAPKARVTIVAPRQRDGQLGFRGTADAVAQNLDLIEAHRPDFVAVFSADHIYRMDVAQMVDEHILRSADATIATIPVALAQCGSFGIVETDQQLWIRDFREKPKTANAAPGHAGHALASMGNYVFSTDVLLEELRRALKAGAHDFGKDILPRLAHDRRVLAYDFTKNQIPGMADFEEQSYWRDVGTIDAYFDAHFDTVGPEPKFRMANPAWPIRFGAENVTAPATVEGSLVTRSVLGAGCIVKSARLHHAMLRRSVQVEPDARLVQSIVMDRSVVGRGARISRAIIDQDNYIPAGEVIGGDLERDRQRFHVSEAGVVVVPRGHFSRSAS